MNPKNFFKLLKDTFTAWNEDKAPRLGAALSYYTVFSLSPMLVVVIGMASLFFGEEAARGEVVRQLQGTVGNTAANAVQEMLQNANKSGDGSSILATIIGLVTVLLGAGGLFGQLQDALNTIWGVKPKPNAGILAMLKDRFISFAMVLGIGFMLLVSLALSAGLAAASKWMSGQFGEVAWLGQIISLLLGFIITTLLFAAIYKVLPDAEIQWHDVWIGAAMTSLLFTIGRFGLGMYLGRPGVESTYGSAGALVILLLWVYYASQILFFGAEFTKAYANEYGSKIVPAENAEAVTPDARARQGMEPEVSVDSAGQKTGKGGAPGAQPASSQEPFPAGVALKPAAPALTASRKRDVEHALAVTAGAAVAVLWFWRRSKSA